MAARRSKECGFYATQEVAPNVVRADPETDMVPNNMRNTNYIVEFSL